MSYHSRIKVRVPATSANLGPGFDCLGLALALYSTFELEISPLAGGETAAEKSPIEIRSEWGPDPAIHRLPTGSENLFYRSFAAHLQRRAVPCPRVVNARMTLGLPPGRGLGSSATAVVGGVLAAEAYADVSSGFCRPFSHLPAERLLGSELLASAVELEHGQHADNVAAALFGGFVVASRDEREQRWQVVQLPVPSDLRAVLFVPDRDMDTVAGRALLPSLYPRADTVHNIGHTALLVAALARNDLEALGSAMDDRCHQPYRTQLFPELPELLEAARHAGAYGVCLSGGGSTILALASCQRAEHIARALAAAARSLAVEGRALVVRIDRSGARYGPDRQPPAATARQRAALPPSPPVAALICPECESRFPLARLDYRCTCGEPLDAVLGGTEATAAENIAGGMDWRRLFDRRLGSGEKLDQSGVWRFRELLLPDLAAGLVPISRPEGRTNCYAAGREQDHGGHGGIGRLVGLDQLWIKHEGENPTGSFKDRGMTVAVSVAKWLGATAVACASTGNTSASMAAYAAQAGLPAIVLLPEGKVAFGKLAQAIAYGAEIRRIPGDFDQAMSMVEEMCHEEGCHLLNSLNPFRLIGQQSLALDILQQLDWEVPDWVVLPAGNLGNTTAVGQGLLLAHRAGLIDRLPRIAAIQASGANPFYRSYVQGFRSLEPVSAETVATAISIGNPVSYRRACRVISATRGVVAQVTDGEILRAKAAVDRSGIGCEPASAAGIAGLCQLVAQGIIASSDRVVAILTGNLLKDPYSVAAGAAQAPELAGEREEREKESDPCWS